MPIHLIYGDDHAASCRAIEKIFNENIDTNWSSFNISKYDGTDLNQTIRCLDEIRIAPFGAGGRVILLKRSPFCNGSSNYLSQKLIDILNNIPKTNHLILNNENKPDKRLKTTKLIQKNIQNSYISTEQNFMLPSVWDQRGQKALIERIAAELNLELEEKATFHLVESIGSDSSRVFTELQKLSLLAESKKQRNYSDKKLFITDSMVDSLVEGITTNSLEIASHLLSTNQGKALQRIDTLLYNGEPPLRLLASLISQTRGWLLVKLLDKEENQEVSAIAKHAGIANPKRIYIIRKQIEGKSSGIFLQLLSNLLDIEASIKKGANPNNAFKDILLTKS